MLSILYAGVPTCERAGIATPGYLIEQRKSVQVLDRPGLLSCAGIGQ